MPEIIVRGNLAVRQLVNSRGFYKLQPVGESLASFVNAATFEFGRGADRPHRETLSRNTGASQKALLQGIELVVLHLDQLIQRLGDTRRDIFKRHHQRPSAIGRCNQSLLHHVLEDGHHEKRIAAGAPVDQVRKSGGKVPANKFDGEIFGDI